MTDGRYCTLALLKQYLGLTVITTGTPGNPSIYQGAVLNTPDDTLLENCIFQAEASFDLVAGTSYDEQTYVLAQSKQTFVDGNGNLHLWARERGPVTAVTAVQVRDLTGATAGWQTITLVTDDVFLPPYHASDTGPHPESWHVMIMCGRTPAATGQIAAKWSYTGGFSTIPKALSMLIARYATWIYKMREAPIGRVTNMPLGSITVPMDVPPEIRRQIILWSPVYG